jgi:hypothetical protein
LRDEAQHYDCIALASTSCKLTLLQQTVAERFPSARVIGTDISAIQPPWSPPNAEFRVEDLDDADRPWTRIYSGADLIHTRSVIQTVRHPELFLQRAYEYDNAPMRNPCPPPLIDPS